jgi:acyl-coenzyme A synthetase/AMP-(fatty) acid ligase
MLLSSKKFASKAEEVLKTELDAPPSYLQLAKFEGGSSHEKVTLEKTGPGSAGMMLYTSGTTNRPVRLPIYNSLVNGLPEHYLIPVSRKASYCPNQS